jgi:hypothetical protein
MPRQGYEHWKAAPWVEIEHEVDHRAKEFIRAVEFMLPRGEHGVVSWGQFNELCLPEFSKAKDFRDHWEWIFAPIIARVLPHANWCALGRFQLSEAESTNIQWLYFLPEAPEAERRATQLARILRVFSFTVAHEVESKSEIILSYPMLEVLEKELEAEPGAGATRGGHSTGLDTPLVIQLGKFKIPEAIQKTYWEPGIMVLNLKETTQKIRTQRLWEIHSPLLETIKISEGDGWNTEDPPLVNFLSRPSDRKTYTAYSELMKDEHAGLLNELVTEITEKRKSDLKPEQFAHNFLARLIENGDTASLKGRLLNYLMFVLDSCPQDEPPAFILTLPAWLPDAGTGQASALILCLKNDFGEEENFLDLITSHRLASRSISELSRRTGVPKEGLIEDLGIAWFRSPLPNDSKAHPSWHEHDLPDSRAIPPNCDRTLARSFDSYKALFHFVKGGGDRRRIEVSWLKWNFERVGNTMITELPDQTQIELPFAPGMQFLVLLVEFLVQIGQHSLRLSHVGGNAIMTIPLESKELKRLKCALQTAQGGEATRDFFRLLRCDNEEFVKFFRSRWGTDNIEDKRLWGTGSIEDKLLGWPPIPLSGSERGSSRIFEPVFEWMVREEEKGHCLRLRWTSNIFP